MDAGFPHADRYDQLRAFALTLPEVIEAPSHGGWPVLKVGKQFFMTLKEDGETLVLKIADGAARILDEVRAQGTEGVPRPTAP